MDIIAGFLPGFGSLLTTALAFVVALSIIVAVHEYGHYIVGRWSGIKAEVFSIGFGPVLFARTDRHGTRWQIAALPFGGYVKFLGDANAASAGTDEQVMARLSAAERRHTMTGAPLWARAATVAAGPVFNFILSILLFGAVMMIAGRATDAPEIGTVYTLPGQVSAFETGDRITAVEGIVTPDYPALSEASESLKDRSTLAYDITRGESSLTVEGPQIMPPRVAQVIPDSAAAEAGIRAGDVVTQIDDQPIASFAQMQGIVSGSDGRALALTLWRAGEVVEVTLHPRRTDIPLRDGGFETAYKMGIGGEMFFTPVTRTVGPWEAVTGGFGEVSFVIRSSLSALTHMISGAISTCNLRGPLGIAETSGAAASAGFSNFVWFLAVLSTAVGLMNLFPIPVLDGGHLVFHLWEAVSGRPPSERAMGVLMTCGFAIVLALMAFGLTNDLRC